MVKVTIDGIEIEVEEGTTILNAARQVGGDIVPPAMCYYSKLEGSGGKCRTCLVEVAAGSERDPRPMPKLMVSCSTQVQHGMVVKNLTSDRVKEARAGVTEFLLANHPLDCPVCDQAGECHLQDLGFENGKEGTRFEEEKRTFAPRDIGDKIKLHMNRCILCYRCVYTANQLTNKRVHGVLNRGDHAEISTYIEKALDNEFIGNVIDVCPVGALTDKTFRFKSRVWFLKPMNAHRDCPTCQGIATVWMFGNEIQRVTGRKDAYGEIETHNGKTAWLCNTCRFESKDVAQWTIEGPRVINRHSVISQGHYVLKNPLEDKSTVKNLK
ncbi:(2Fe-2S)-binding protein [Crocinitomicaceae bacterium CZZ-1]|uniref:(2Fe-2S)-binding protein n=1 Tax=Taishania pollutisoli TaxID=2766479 RepID=A0A8J6TWY2_9FLAO|nr:2Fe-2S iron-sulfur cluster-binding protein [Taishania pollutisoli]MBC9811681.1 (2Fe-2S)-binding protein [Taishania pollutisoli]MBX2948384.1 (2Fe-2S)-binding protein [Crocinitomicaceae bacterium]NGF75482.1 2Fe-2S iron-sulfur cluster binding domain-containing protein [Fluviicola sp. SGL-29]